MNTNNNSNKEQTIKPRNVFFIRLVISVFVILTLFVIWKIKSERLFLEHRDATYYDLFLDNEGKTNHQNCKDAESQNLLVIDKRKVQEYNGISVTYNEDGSIYVQGKNNGDGNVYIRLSPSNRYKLHDGEYIISDGLNEEQRKGVLFYYESRDIFSDHTDYIRLANLPEQPRMIVDNSLHDDFGLVLGFTTEFESTEPLVIYPMIRRANDTEGNYQPPAILKTNIDEEQPAFQTFLLEKTELDQLTDSDWKLLCNSVNYQFKEKYIWTSIIFEDGTGIQFKESDASQAVYGPIDPWGRVEDVVSEIHSLEDVREICSFV